LETSASPNKFVVALTGGIGSGKSSVAKLFGTYGIEVIDTDALAHALTAPGGAAISAISDEFGSQFIEPDGRMNRVMMRNHVFSDPNAKLALEAIVHPLIREKGAQALLDATSPYVIVDVPLLAETATREGSWASRAQRILVVDCSVETQITRVIARSEKLTPNSPMTRHGVQIIIDAQASRSARLAFATDVIDNSGDTTLLADRVHTLHQLYFRLSRASV
jgi:dephospho-CoA kinase